MRKPLTVDCPRCGAELPLRGGGQHFSQADFIELFHQFIELQTTGRWTEEYARMGDDRRIVQVTEAHVIRPITRIERAPVDGEEGDPFA